MGYTLRSDRFRYVKWLQLDYKQGARKGRMLATELYDYQTDPNETINLSKDPKYTNLIKAFEAEFKRRNVAQIN